MLGMDHGEHLLIAQKAIVILLGLGVETGIVVRIPGGRTGGRAHDVLVKPAHPSGPVGPRPVVVATIRIGVAITYEPVAAFGGRRKYRVKAEQPEPAGFLEIRVGWNRFNFHPPDLVVTRVMTYLVVLDRGK